MHTCMFLTGELHHEAEGFNLDAALAALRTELLQTHYEACFSRLAHKLTTANYKL